MKTSELWDARAQHYAAAPGVEDATELEAWRKFLSRELGPVDHLTEIGPGTGAFTSVVMPLVRQKYTAAEISPEMARRWWDCPAVAEARARGVEIRQVVDTDSAAKVTPSNVVCGRLVLRHLGTLSEGLIRMGATDPWVRRIVVAEGVPPKHAGPAFDLYVQTMSRRAGRREIFTVGELHNAGQNFGFRLTSSAETWITVSLRDWLSKTALSPEERAEIFRLHDSVFSSSEDARDAYRAEHVGNDWIMCWRRVIVLYRRDM